MVINVEIKKFAINMTIVSITSAIAKTITAPIERIKLILQNQDSALQVLTGERTKYRGIIDCIRRLPKEQGFWSFWRGNGTNIIRYFPTQALNFAFNDAFKKMLYSNVTSSDSPVQSVLLKFLSGGIAGACTISITYPLEFCQTLIAVDAGSDHTKSEKLKGAFVKREFNGFYHCLEKTCKLNGFRALYGGFPIAVIGISCYRALYFGLFDSFKHRLSHTKHSGVSDAPKPPIYVGLILAQGATCVAGMCTYPLDTVARRLMLDSGRPKEMKLFKNKYDAFRSIYRRGGIMAFYNGVFTNCLRGLSGAMVLVFYDEFLHYTKWKEWLSPCDNC